MILHFIFNVSISYTLIATRMMVNDMEHHPLHRISPPPELHSPIGEGINGSNDEANEIFDSYAESDFPALDTPNDQDDGMQLPGIPFGEK